MKLGAQLYTVRDYCKDLDSFAETLAKVADIGYTTVQVSGTCEYEADWLKEQLDKNGLACPLTHFNLDKIEKEPQAVMSFHEKFGCKNIGIGWYEPHKNGVKPLVERFKESGRLLGQNGFNLCYHNHGGEFTKNGDKTVFDEIAKAFTPDELKFTVDTYWAQLGGCDPAQLIRSLKDRAPCIHLKDMAYDRLMMAVGSGNMNFEAVFAAAEYANVDYAFVEQDDCNGENPFDCLKSSYDYCKSCGIE